MTDKKRVDDLDFSDLDFQDDAGFDVDLTSQDMSPSNEDALDTEKTSEKAPAKKMNPMILLGGLVALIVVGGGAAWQMGVFGSDQPYQVPAMPAAEGVAVETGPVVSNESTDPFAMPVPETEAEMAAASQAALEAANAALPDLEAAAQAETALVTGITDANGETITEAAEVMPAVAPETVPMPQPVPDTITAQPLVAQPSPTQPAPMAASVDLEPVLARLDALEKRLENAESKPADTTPAPEVMKELETLKAELAELKTMRAEAPPAAKPKAAAAPKKKSASAKKAKPKTTAAKSAEADWDKPYSGSPSAPSATANNNNTSLNTYSLRAAQPGAAWISDQNDTLRQVKVGDVLPDIGTVTAIAQSNGRWEVVTTTGRIAQ